MRILLLTVALCFATNAMAQSGKGYWASMAYEAMEMAESNPKNRALHLANAEGFYQKESETNGVNSQMCYKWGTVLAQLFEIKGDKFLADKGVEKFEEAIDLNPDFAVAYLQWGKLLYNAGRKTDSYDLLVSSIDQLDKAMLLDSKLVEARDFRARAALLLKDRNVLANKSKTTDTPHIVDNAATGTPLPATAIVVGECSAIEHTVQPRIAKLLQMKDIPSTLLGMNLADRETYEQIKREVASMQYRGSYKVEQEKFVDKYKQESKVTPGNWAGYYKYGKAMYYLAQINGDVSLYRVAISHLKEAVRLNPSRAAAHDTLSSCLIDFAQLTGEDSLYKEAIEESRKTLSINKEDYPAAYINWGIALRALALRYDDMPQLRQALNMLEQGAKVEPMAAFHLMATTLSLLADKTGERGLDARTINAFDRAIRIDPTDARIYYNYAVACANIADRSQNLNTYYRSAELFRKSCSLDSDDAATYLNWGATLMGMLEVQGEVGDYKTDMLYCLTHIDKLSYQSAAYDMTRMYSVLGDHGRAYYWLHRYFTKEYQYTTSYTKTDFDQDPLLKGIKDSGEYKELVK